MLKRWSCWPASLSTPVFSKVGDSNLYLLKEGKFAGGALISFLKGEGWSISLGPIEWVL